MDLPLAVNAGNYTLANHALWHNEIDSRLAWLGFPTNLTAATPSGHLAYHEALATYVGRGLDNTLNENDPLHWHHHEQIHDYLTVTPNTASTNTCVAGLPAGFVCSDGTGRLRLNGQPYRFTGYGTTMILGCATGFPESDSSVNTLLANLRQNSVIRFWASDNPRYNGVYDYTYTNHLNAVKHVLDLIRADNTASGRNTKVILSLADANGNGCGQYDNNAESPPGY